MLTRKIVDQQKSQGHRGPRKVKCEINRALVMINLYHVYVKFKSGFELCETNYNAKSGGQTNAPGDDNRHPPKF